LDFVKRASGKKLGDSPAHRRQADIYDMGQVCCGYARDGRLLKCGKRLIGQWRLTRTVGLRHNKDRDCDLTWTLLFNFLQPADWALSSSGVLVAWGLHAAGLGKGE